MATSIDAIIDRQFRRWELERSIGHRPEPEREGPAGAHPLITVSREHGSVGSAVAASLADRFGYTLLNRDVIDRMCQSTGYSRQLLEALDDRSRSQMATWFDSMVGGLYFDSTDYVRALFTTLYSIARLGGVVVVGRGANFIIGRDRGFHIRVVAPREDRIRAIAERKGVSLRDAAHEVAVRDHERSEFVRRMFHRSADDPLAYDLVINAAGASPRALAEWLAVAARQKFERLRPLEAPAR
jgi:cytidylate kinase